MIIVALSVPFAALSSPDALAKEEARLLKITNEFRAVRGLPALAPIAALSDSAEIKSRDMAANNYFAHESPRKVSLPELMNQVGYRYEEAGENLAMGYASAESVLRAWIESPSHLAILSNPQFTEFGNAFIPGTFAEYRTIYVTEHFGRPARSGGAVKVLSSGESKDQIKKETPNINKSAVQAMPAQEVRGEEVSAVSVDPVKIPPPTLSLKYELGKNFLTEFTSGFAYWQGMYIFFALFFLAALGINIFVEIRKQHFHIIAQTGAMVLLLAVMALY